MEDYETAVILQAYNKGIIGMPNYVAIEKFSKMINWKKISSAYRIKKGFKSIAQKLVKQLLKKENKQSKRSIENILKQAKDTFKSQDHKKDNKEKHEDKKESKDKEHKDKKESKNKDD